MRAFLIKTISFLVPVIMVWMTYEFLMHRLGESQTVKTVLAHQQQQGGLFMRKFLSQEFNRYKLEGIAQSRADLLAVGSSRVMKFRKEFFKSSFYNAGGLLQNHQDLWDFLQNPPQAEMIILGLDPWWFKEDNIQRARSWIQPKGREKVHTLHRFKAVAEFSALFKEVGSTRHENHHGAFAQRLNGGFRVDGSMKTPDNRIALLLKEGEYTDTENPPIPKRMREGLTLRYSHSRIDTAAYLHTLELVKKCQQKGIEILIYLPPFASEAYQTFKETPQQAAFFSFATQQMEQLARQAGLNVLPVESPDHYELPDTYFTDGNHPSEVFVAHQLLRHHGLLGNRVDQAFIRTQLEEPFCELQFFREAYQGQAPTSENP